MNTIERTRRIIDLLNETSEQLKAYADDLWLNVDRSTPESIQEGADEQKAFLSGQNQFSELTSYLEELIRDDLSEDARERIDEVDEQQRERLIVQLDRTTPHSLDEEFTSKCPYAIRLVDDRVGQHNTWKATYRWWLQQLHHEDPVAFDQLIDADFALTIRGNRYVSREKKDVRSPITVGDLYFESNFSANDIRNKMKEVLHALDRSTDEVTIYLREDRDA